jgi:hypothetical protein
VGVGTVRRGDEGSAPAVAAAVAVAIEAVVLVSGIVGTSVSLDVVVVVATGATVVEVSGAAEDVVSVDSNEIAVVCPAAPVVVVSASAV